MQELFTDRPFYCDARGVIVDQMDVYKIRKRRLLEYIADNFKGNRSAFCRAVGEDGSYIARIYTDNKDQSKPFTETIARRIEVAARLPTGWLDGAAKTLDTPPIQAQSAEHPLVDLYQQLSPVNQAKTMAFIYQLIVQQSEPQQADARGKRDNFEPRTETPRHFERPKRGDPHSDDSVVAIRGNNRRKSSGP